MDIEIGGWMKDGWMKKGLVVEWMSRWIKRKGISVIGYVFGTTSY